VPFRLLPMNSRITLAAVDRLQATVDTATRLHRLGLLLFFAACVLVTLPRGGMPAWVPQAAMLATLLAFGCKLLATRREIRLARLLGRIMALPYRRPAHGGHGSDHSAWSAIRAYVVASVVLTVAVALAPSMLASLGEVPVSNLVAMLRVAALVLQSFDHQRRMHGRILQICLSRLEPHGGEDGVLAA
jgi:hypothetical protein